MAVVLQLNNLCPTIEVLDLVSDLHMWIALLLLLKSNRWLIWTVGDRAMDTWMGWDGINAQKFLKIPKNESSATSSTWNWKNIWRLTFVVIIVACSNFSLWTMMQWLVTLLQSCHDSYRRLQFDLRIFEVLIWVWNFYVFFFNL